MQAAMHQISLAMLFLPTPTLPLPFSYPDPEVDQGGSEEDPAFVLLPGWQGWRWCMLIYGQKAAAMWIEGSSAYSHNEYTYSSEGPTRKTLAGPTPLLDKYGTKHIMCFICVARSLEVMPGCVLTTTTSQKESQVN